MDLDRKKAIERASLVGIVGNLSLAVVTILAGWIAGSLALLGAGIDTATDIVTSVITLFTARIAAKPPDREHPYGHSRAETIATKLLSFIIFFAGAQLATSTIHSLVNRDPREIPTFLAVIVSLVSLIGKIFLYLYKIRAGRRINSSMVIADAKNMLGDVVLSGSVLIGLFLTRFLGLAFLDQVMALLVSVWIMRTALIIFMESNDELMDGIGDEGIYRQIFEAVNSVPGAGNPHRVRVRKLNTLYVVDLDIEVDGQINVTRGHQIAVKVEKAIRASVADIYDIIVHVEPQGNLERSEQYGLSEQNMEEKPE